MKDLLRDMSRLFWTRVTTCRRHGHHYPFDQYFCRNCGAPWRQHE